MKLIKIKIIFGISIFMFLIASFGEDKKKVIDEKIYTQKEFDEKVENEVVKRLAKVTGSSLKDYALSLITKEKENLGKEKELDKKSQEINIVEKDLLEKVKEFRIQQDKIIGCMSENEKESSQRVEHIVQIISSMKPVNAAQILSVQDSSISVQIISRLKPDKISKIFNLMDKEISARLQKEYINMKR